MPYEIIGGPVKRFPSRNGLRLDGHRTVVTCLASCDGVEGMRKKEAQAA